MAKKNYSKTPPGSIKKKPIIFRHSVPEMTSNTYGAFSIYKYPAKFIPQVIAFVLKKYAKPGMRVFDPFAGYGTVGVVSRLYGYDYELWDLNPLLSLIHNTALMKEPKINVSSLLNEIKSSRKGFVPNWLNLRYWFPEQFLPVLFKTWGFVHSMNPKTKNALLIPLLRTTRYFSFSDEKIHKLYKSKYSKRKIETMLKRDWKHNFYNTLEKEIFLLLRRIREYNSLNPKVVKCRIRPGIDTLGTELNSDVDLLITSPPYLQAQEYIRSTKLELFWLGHKESYIKELSRKEIPYNPVKRIEIHSEKYYKFRRGIKEDHLSKLYDRYFHAILNTFSTLGERVRSYMFIFVGPAKIRTTPIPIDDIVIEHLQNDGWKHEITYIDKIVSRAMFESNINPASGMKDKRIKTEHLVVLRK